MLLADPRYPMQYSLMSTFTAEPSIILRLTAPLIGRQIALVGLSVTDLYMVGQYSAEALAGAQLTGNIWSTTSLLIIRLMIGNNSIIGNYGGAQ